MSVSARCAMTHAHAGETYHDLAEHGQGEILHIAVARVGDDEDETDDGVGRRGLEEHGRDRDVGRGVVLAHGLPQTIAHAQQLADEEQCEDNIEGDRDGEVG